MNPPKRLPENKPLPARWVCKHGAYYYIPPADMRAAWDGKSWYRLGATLPEAHAEFARRMQGLQDRPPVATIGGLLDRYLLEVVPSKAAKTATGNRAQIANLRAVFGAVGINDIEPHHVYKYAAARGKLTAAKREIEVLSHAFTKAVEWGLMKAHPFKGEVRIADPKPRTRYVEDWELAEALALAPVKRKGSVLMVQAYLRLKLLTGLRQRDLLLLTASSIREDGIHVTPSKTAGSTGRSLIYTWSNELRAAVEAARAARPCMSPYLFCTLQGKCFVAEDGTAGNWNNIWQNFMARVLAETRVSERFTEHDLRAKVGSDAETLARAQELLAHADPSTTKRVYRRRAEIVKPTK